MIYYVTGCNRDMNTGWSVHRRYFSGWLSGSEEQKFIMIAIVRICYIKATNGEQITDDTNKSFTFKDVALGTSIWAPNVVLPGRVIPNHGFPF